MDATETTDATKNTVTVQDAGPCRKKISVEIPEEAIKTALDEQYGDLHKEAVVPGFRKGRAPRRLLEKRFSKEVSEQVKLKLIADGTEAAIKDHSLSTLTDPQVDCEGLQLPESGPFKFDFEVEVIPEFELPSLEAIPVQKPRLQVTDEQIAEQISQLQKQTGIWVPVESGSVERDDLVVADVVVTVDDGTQQKLENIEIYVRETALVAEVPVRGLDTLLITAKAGEVRKTTVEVPKTYYQSTYRGRKVDLEIRVSDVKRLKPAEINSSFLGRFGVESETELKEKVQELLTARIERQSYEAMAQQVSKHLMDNTSFELPAEVVANSSARILRRQSVRLLLQGFTREQIEQQMEQLRAASEQQAQEQVKLLFIIDKIAARLGIEVTDEEINGYIAQVATRQGRRPEKVRQEMIRDGSLAGFSLQVREEKCLRKLLESAKVADIELSTPESPQDRQDSSKTRDESTPERKKPVRRKKGATKQRSDRSTT